MSAGEVHEQFVLHYQPNIDVATGATFGAEALVGWQHPTRGMLYPDAFLPAIEQSGLMNALTGIVLEAAVTQLADWRESGLDISLAVNLSASDLLDEALVERIAELLRDHAVPAAALELEITESVIMIDLKRARDVLVALRGLGLRIAVDDYGTGYCALAYLRDFPVDELKIDRGVIAAEAPLQPTGAGRRLHRGDAGESDRHRAAGPRAVAGDPARDGPRTEVLQAFLALSEAALYGPATLGRRDQAPYSSWRCSQLCMPPSLRPGGCSQSSWRPSAVRSSQL